METQVQVSVDIQEQVAVDVQVPLGVEIKVPVSLECQEEVVEKPAKPPGKALKFPPCCVCGGKASGLHYGVNSCEACKGFFRRYLIKNEEYTCHKGGNCKITNRSRGNCAGCRLRKCLSLGMSKTASRLGRYTLSQRTKTILAVHQLQDVGQGVQQQFIRDEMDASRDGIISAETSPAQDSSCTSSPGQGLSGGSLEGSQSGFRNISGLPSIPASPPVNQSEIENLQELLRVLTTKMYEIKPYGREISMEEMMQKIEEHHEKYIIKLEIFGELRAVPDDEYYSVLRNHGIDLDGRWKALKDSAADLEGIIARYVNFAKAVPGFTELSIKDQSILLKVARCDFFLVLMHRGYVESYKIFMAHNCTPYHLNEAANKFFSRDLCEGILKAYSKWQKLQISDEEMVLLIAISLVFPDRCSLEHPDQVESIQLEMIRYLRLLLKDKYGSLASTRFTKMIDCYIMMRDTSELYFKEYKSLCTNDLIIEEVPMMLEFLMEDDI